MKTSLILLLSIVLLSPNKIITDERARISFPFPKIKLEQLALLLEGNWEYDYSFNNKEVFEIDGSYFSSFGYVPYRLEFNKSSKRMNKKIQEDHAWLHKLREASCLRELEFWVDDKGMMRYPKLVSKETDSNGNLLACRIELYTRAYPDLEPSYITINSITNGIMVISSYQEGIESDFHVFVNASK